MTTPDPAPTPTKKDDGEGAVMRTKPFVVGQAYRTKSGDTVTITRELQPGTPYGCVEGSDGLWRYNREWDRGRVTASAFDMSCPMNLVPERDQP